MSGGLGRREFLKLMGLLPAMEVRWPWREGGQTGQPNVVILVFDTLSAQHVTLHGYGRETTPNLARFAERATVYHNCYSAGNFTTPGTASLLTGTYPWTHRALHLHGVVQEAYRERSLFHLFPEETYKIAYTHNILVTLLLHQFRDGLNLFKPTRDLTLRDDEYSDLLFFRDYSASFWSELAILRGGDIFPSSLFLSVLHKLLFLNFEHRSISEFADRFPRGIPHNFTNLHFILEDAIDWIAFSLREAPRPFLGYFHLLPPHEPYRPRSEFIGRFNDGWQAPEKPVRHFSEGFAYPDLHQLRTEYDEFVAYTDAEFGRLIDLLEASGSLDNTFLVVTSDHGQLFERGIHGHITGALYEPLIRVPLLISRPGQQLRRDIHSPVSGVDILPTLLSLANQPIPSWCEGRVLPGFRDSPIQEGRSIYVLEAKSNSKRGPLSIASLALIRGQEKLTRYYGYRDAQDEYEMYDLESDPEEMQDLSSSQTTRLRDLREEMENKLQEINASTG